MAYISFQPGDFYNTVLYTGNGSTQSVTGVGFQPDLNWIKDNSTDRHNLTDAVRGATYWMRSDQDAASTADVNAMTAFNADGFSVGSTDAVNKNTIAMTSWNWKANGAGSANTDGGIESTVSVNTTSKFSIVTWTGTGSASTIGHGLGVRPEMVILKSTSNVYGWYTWITSLTSPSLPASNNMNQYMKLDSNAGRATDTSAFGSTAPTSTVFPIGTGNAGTNSSGHTYLAYCFASVKGYSRIGTYKGNADTNGTFIYTGFRPAFILTKEVVNARNWGIFDTKRTGFNPENDQVYPDLAGSTDIDSNSIDILSNGWKARVTDNWVNGGNAIHSYMAFAEFPFVSSNDLPGVAR